MVIDKSVICNNCRFKNIQVPSEKALIMTLNLDMDNCIFDNITYVNTDVDSDDSEHVSLIEFYS